VKRLEIAPSQFRAATGPSVVHIYDGATELAVILDGTGSWEAGDEHATAAANELRILWRSDAPSSAIALRDHVFASAARQPDVPQETSFGRPGFSLAAVLCNTTCTAVACGSYAVLRVAEENCHVLFWPRFWVDEQVMSGNLSEAEAATHQLRHVFMGPLVASGMEEQCYLSEPIAEGMIVLATAELARRLRTLPLETWQHLSAAEIQALEEDGSAHLRPVILWRGPRANSTQQLSRPDFGPAAELP
jgi:hypothetical protein